MKFFLALWLYRLVLLCLTPILLVFFLIRSNGNPNYRLRLLERLGILPRSLKTNGLIVHAASVGEVIAIKSFIDQLLNACPNMAITVTTFTPTGSAQVKKIFAERVQHCYLPLDNLFSTWLFLKTLKPQAMVFMETELWPNLVAQCAHNNIRLLLINARLSQRSCRGYQKAAWLFKPCLQRFDHILTQSFAYQQNFINLGAQQQKCTVSGNLKYDINLTKSTLNKVNELSQYLIEPRQIWLVASTHLGDDEIILNAFKIIKKRQPELLLLLVPRHPERFNDVATLCQVHGFTLYRRSEQRLVPAHTDIWLLDTLGELMAAYGLADVVTMAGTFSTIGGHNPLEAALFKKPIVLGADMANFNEILTQLKQASAVIQLPLGENIAPQLASTLIELFANQQQRQQLGENAYQVVRSNQGASEISVKTVQQLLGLS